MSIAIEQAKRLIEDYSNAFPGMPTVPEEDIQICLSDRPITHLTAGMSPSFFISLRDRLAALPSQIRPDFDAALSEMISFLNQETDSLTIYHYSLYPLQTEFEHAEFGELSVTQLDDQAFQRLVDTHSLQAPIKGLAPDLAASFRGPSEENLEKYPIGYRALVVSRFIAQRTEVHVDRHGRFDVLDDIYSRHSILVHLLQHFSGAQYTNNGSFSSDTFPNASASWSSQVYQSAVNGLDAKGISKTGEILALLSPMLFYRLLIRCEIQNRDIFARLIFLRSILDPFFERHKQAISAVVKSTGLNRTNAQAKALLVAMEKLGCARIGELTDSDTSEFLKVRNSFVHPNPQADITSLHVLYDKEHEFRKLVYEFVAEAALRARQTDQDIFDFELTV